MSRARENVSRFEITYLAHLQNVRIFHEFQFVLHSQLLQIAIDGGFPVHVVNWYSLLLITFVVIIKEKLPLEENNVIDSSFIFQNTFFQIREYKNDF